METHPRSHSPGKHGSGKHFSLQLQHKCYCIQGYWKASVLLPQGYSHFQLHKTLVGNFRLHVFTVLWPCTHTSHFRMLSRQCTDFTFVFALHKLLAIHKTYCVEAVTNATSAFTREKARQL